MGGLCGIIPRVIFLTMIKQPTIVDVDNNESITQSDIDLSNEILELNLREEKAVTQKRMAWVAIISMILFTAILFSPLITDNRVNALSNLLGLFYIAQAGVVGAYMGVTAWLSRSVNPSYNNYASSSRYSYITTAKQVPQPPDPII